MAGNAVGQAGMVDIYIRPGCGVVALRALQIIMVIRRIVCVAGDAVRESGMVKIHICPGGCVMAL